MTAFLTPNLDPETSWVLITIKKCNITHFEKK